MTDKRIILASASPRRKELLYKIIDDFEIAVSHVSEETDIKEPKELVAYLASIKARDIFKDNKDAVVIGADTVVAIDGDILGKPENDMQAMGFLRMLSGRSHSVFTGVCVKSEDGEITAVCETKVSFDNLSEQDIKEYVESGESSDKAGGYGIQGKAAKFVTGIEGCYYNVMGLPVNLLWNMLKDV